MLTYAFINGNIITVEEEIPIAQAVGVTGNCISFVGTNEEIHEKMDGQTQVVDLGGRTLMPGLIDSHYHPILSGLIGVGPKASIIDTFAEHCPTLEDLLDLVREAAKGKSPENGFP